MENYHVYAGDEPIVNDEKYVRELFSHILKEEGEYPTTLEFGRVLRGGAVTEYIEKRVLKIKMDLYTIPCGAAYALIHEIAHLIEIRKNGNGSHDRHFKATERRLLKKYEHCDIARKIIF